MSRSPSTLIAVFGLGLFLLHALSCLFPDLRKRLADRTVVAKKTAAGHVFPSDFLFGVATSAHQIEGGNDQNDWWAFEEEPGHIANGERSGLASDHFRRATQDVALMTFLGARAYRFSIEWSRAERADGTSYGRGTRRYFPRSPSPRTMTRLRKQPLDLHRVAGLRDVAVEPSLDGLLHVLRLRVAADGDELRPVAVRGA